MMLRSFAPIMTLLATSLGSLCAQSAGDSSNFYELRIYTATAGKLADFQIIFRNQALPLFAKYGIENVFDGTVLQGAPSDAGESENMLICVVRHQNRVAADKSWAAFERDAEWRSALKRAEQGGPLLAKPPVSIFMNPADFSPALEPPSIGSTTRVFELRKYNTGPSGLPRTLEQFKSGLAAILVKNGMTPIAYWTADDSSAFIYLLAHKDRDAARASWASFMTDFRPFMTEFNARVPPAPPGSRKPDDNRFLIPTDYSPRR